MRPADQAGELNCIICYVLFRLREHVLHTSFNCYTPFFYSMWCRSAKSIMLLSPPLWAVAALLSRAKSSPSSQQHISTDKKLIKYFQHKLPKNTDYLHSYITTYFCFNNKILSTQINPWKKICNILNYLIRNLLSLLF